MNLCEADDKGLAKAKIGLYSYILPVAGRLFQNQQGNIT
jgi:hypothetical protein